MRRRKWVLIVTAIVVTIVVGWYVAWRMIKANEIIRDALLARIRPFLAQESDIEKVDVDLHSLYLRGVMLAPKDRSFSLEIEEIRLGYRFINLLKYRFAPQKLAHEVVLVRPALIIRKDFTKIQSMSSKAIWLDPRKVVEELEAVRRVTMVDAEVFVLDSTDKKIRLAHSMNGWLHAIPTDSAFIRLEGRLLETNRKNLMLEGKLNLLTGRPVRMQVQIEESEMGSELPFIVPDYISVQHGRMKGEVTIDQAKGSSGYVEILDGAFSFKKADIGFENINVKGIIKGSDLIMEGGIQSFNGSPLTFSGMIMDIIRDPHLDLSVHCSRFDIPLFFQHTMPETQLSLDGEAQFDFRYSGSLGNPTMSGDFVSTNLNAYGFEFDHFGATVGLKDSVFIVQGEGEQTDGVALALKGEIDFSDSLETTVLAVDVKGNALTALPQWCHSRINACGGEMKIRMWGALRNLQGEALGVMSFDWGEEKTLQLNPSFWYKDKNLHVEVTSNNGFNLMGDLKSLFYANAQWEIQVQEADVLLEPLLAENLQPLIENVDIDAGINRSENGWGVWLEGFQPKERELPLLFEIGLTSGGDQKKRDEIEVQGVYFGPGGENLTLSALGIISETSFAINRCEIGDFLSLKGFYPLDSDMGLQGDIKFSDFLFEKLHGIFPQLEHYSGELQGGVEITGTRSEPEVHLELNLRDGRFHSVGIFDGQLNYIWDNGKIRLSEISLRKDGNTLLSGKAEWVEGDSLIGGFRGEDIDFGEIILALTGKDFFQGIGKAEFTLSSGIDEPMMRGMINVNEGMVGPIHFKALKTKVVDTLSTQFDFRGGWFSLQNGILERDDGLQVRFWGHFPNGGQTDGDIYILGQGNILGFLTETSQFFKKAEGSGEILLRLAGRDGEWEIGEGRMHIDDGTLEMAAFVEEVKNLKGEVTLRQEDRFIHISYLTGETEGETFTFSNRMMDEDSEDLIPIVLERWGVHCGILELQTMGKGIRVHLPGFMEKREKGWLAFEGKDSGEKFNISGPVESPSFMGSIKLTDNRLTYPFLNVEGDSGAARMIEFLEKVNWDLRVIPEKDVHYVRNIESPLGNVYLDLLLQNGTGEIRLAGIIEDNDLDVWGNLVSREGSVEVLDHYFKPERITFDYPRGSTDPIISGRAFTTVIDSMGMPSTVWLSLTKADDISGFENEGGPWGQVQFRFYSDNPNLGRTQADLFAAMGYSSENLKDRAYDALGTQVENVVFRPIFRPLERGIRRYLGLDVVRFSSMLTRNLVQMRSATNNTGFDPKFLLRSSKLTLGKYLAPGLFIIYSGQVQQGMGLHYHTHGLGFRHAFSLEYTIRPDLFLQMEYTYDSQLLSDRREDKRIWLRHVFPF